MAFGRLGSLGSGFGKLGSPLGGAGSTPPPTEYKILLETGDKVLQEDGTSKIKKEPS